MSKISNVDIRNPDFFVIWTNGCLDCSTKLDNFSFKTVNATVKKLHKPDFFCPVFR